MTNKYTIVLDATYHTNSGLGSFGYIKYDCSTGLIDNMYFWNTDACSSLNELYLYAISKVLEDFDIAEYNILIPNKNVYYYVTGRYKAKIPRLADWLEGLWHLIKRQVKVTFIYFERISQIEPYKKCQ